MDRNLWSSKGNFKRSQRQQQKRIFLKEWRFESDFFNFFNPFEAHNSRERVISSLWMVKYFDLHTLRLSYEASDKSRLEGRLSDYGNVSSSRWRIKFTLNHDFNYPRLIFTRFLLTRVRITTVIYGVVEESVDCWFKSYPSVATKSAAVLSRWLRIKRLAIEHSDLNDFRCPLRAF